MKKYYLGLDIGTSSIGWAVTDEHYNLVRKKGKDLWGVRLFKEGDTAAKRRIFRSNMRRTQRKTARLQILRDIFKEEIERIDPSFFSRLDESKFWEEDKNTDGKYSLFNDKNFNDKDYYKKYPTIFHLRKDLISGGKKKDVRLYFLAINQMMKRRGHFLIDGRLENVNDITPLKNNLKNTVNEEFNLDLDDEFFDSALEISFDNKEKKTTKKNNIKKLVNNYEINESKRMCDIFNLLISGKMAVKNIFPIPEIYEKAISESKSDFYLNGEKYDENNDFFEKLLDEKYTIITSLKLLYDYNILQAILGGEKYLSHSQVKRYDKHKNDLERLKKLIKKYSYGERKDFVDFIFKAFFKYGEIEVNDLKNNLKLTKSDIDMIKKVEASNYPSYIGQYKIYPSDKLYNKVRNYNEKGKKRDNCKTIPSTEDKYSIEGKILNDGKNHEDNKYIKIILKKVSYQDILKNILYFLPYICDEGDEEYIRIKKDIEAENFLQKQITNSNSVIPNQIHQIELEKILDNLCRDYPSFLDIEDEVSKREKINLTFKFRIPYFVGPLNNYHSDKGGNSWIKKNDDFKNERIRPWNFDKIVDLHACEEEFIKRLINECTYLPDEKVIPKSSLLYSEYLVLNELNNLRINGNKLDKNIKMDLIDKLYKRDRRVTLKKIKKFLEVNNYILYNEVLIEDDGGGIKSNLNSFIDFYEILGEFDEDMVEDIIELVTIHTGNKKLLRNTISQRYTNLTETQVSKIINLKYKDWARFSRKLLIEMEGSNKETGETNTIIGFLRENNENFMELMSKRYDFDEKIKLLKLQYLSEKLDYSVVDNLYVSPSVKKMIWQVVKLNHEIIKVIGEEPDKIFIETARGKEENSKMKDSRKTKLLNLYENIKNNKNFSAYVEKNKIKIDEKMEGINGKAEADFRSKSIFLYYLQAGKCAYSGENIDLGNILGSDSSKFYDIDHIIPKCMKKDDSIINNLVLVKKELNQSIKGDTYPLSDVKEIYDNPRVQELWRFLYDSGFMTKEKYKRLVRNTPLTDTERAEFINRQLVETRQSTKAIKELFENYYKNSKIITVKAGLVSELRHDFDILKCREINDLHHAHDAFLNIIVGDVWNKKFTSNPYKFLKKNREKYNLNKIFTTDQKKFGKEIWNVVEGKKIIIKTLNKPSVLFSSENYEEKGELFNQTIIKKSDYNKNTQYLPIKKDERLKDISKYGGYKSLNIKYFFLVEHLKRKKRIKTIESMSIYFAHEVEKDEKKLIEYCIKVLKLEEPKIIKEKIKKKTQIKMNGFNYLISGKSSNDILLEPCEQMFWSVEETKVFKEMYNKFSKSISLDEMIFEKKDREVLEKLFMDIKTRLGLKPYINRINIPNIESVDIDKLSEFDLFKLIDRLLQITRKTTSTIDLSFVGLLKNVGKASRSKNLKETDEIYIVYKSLTGIYERVERI